MATDMLNFFLGHEDLSGKALVARKGASGG